MSIVTVSVGSRVLRLDGVCLVRKFNVQMERKECNCSETILEHCLLSVKEGLESSARGTVGLEVSFSRKQDIYRLIL